MNVSLQSFIYMKPINVNYFCFLNHKSVFVKFPKKMSLKIENILAHVFMQSGLDKNPDRTVSNRTQCSARKCVLCIVVCSFNIFKYILENLHTVSFEVRYLMKIKKKQCVYKLLL